MRIPIFVLGLITVSHCLAFARLSGPAVEPDDGLGIDLSLLQGHRVSVHYRVKQSFARVHLLRTLSPIAEDRLHRRRYPVVELADSSQAEGTLVDDQLSDRTTAYYWLEVERGRGLPRQYATEEIRIPNTRLPERLSGLNLVIDKTHYSLALREGTRTLKRYPVALGANPVDCKLCQDRQCTPEGIYHIQAVQPHAQYHRALDLDYPNSFDRQRYQVLRSLGYLPAGRSIGGEIELHGDVKKNEEVFSNWTWGCIAMRNADLDELLAHPEVRPGLQVAILGQTFRSLDQPTDVDRCKRELLLKPGASLMRALAVYQHRRGLPLSCRPDPTTLAALDTEVESASR